MFGSNSGNLITYNHSYFLNFLLLFELQEIKMHHSGFYHKIRILLNLRTKVIQTKKIGFIAEKIHDNCSINHLGFMISYTI